MFILSLFVNFHKTILGLHGDLLWGKVRYVQSHSPPVRGMAELGHPARAELPGWWCSTITRRGLASGGESGWPSAQVDRVLTPVGSKTMITALGGNDVLTALYRAPGVREEHENRVHEEFRRACGKGRVLIVGDFNFPGIDWVHQQGKDRADEDLIDLVQDFF
uniref:Endonuclease/exonuclease/phosphatase domain-containing protein n=1 Tax=Eptatretus burgeri TaxID=7764 RepID=A0A8C4PW90_EPTBU